MSRSTYMRYTPEMIGTLSKIILDGWETKTYRQMAKEAKVSENMILYIATTIKKYAKKQGIVLPTKYGIRGGVNKKLNKEAVLLALKESKYYTNNN